MMPSAMPITCSEKNVGDQKKTIANCQESAHGLAMSLKSVRSMQREAGI